MSYVEEISGTAGPSSEFEGLVALSSTTLDAIPGAIFICDREGWLARYNNEAVELWGKAPALGENGARLGGTPLMFLPEGAHVGSADCPIAKALITGEATRNAEVIMEREDGSRSEVMLNARALRDRLGAIEGVIGCIQNVSVEHALAAQHRRQQEDLEDFFNNSAVGLHIVNDEGIIVRANQSELTLLGFNADEYIGRNIADFHVDAPVIADILHRLSSGGRLENYPARLRAKDGTFKHVLITSNGRFEQGRFVNTRCFTVDVTALRDAENARRESEDRLSATYEAATIGIAEADADGRLLRVNDAICEMLGRSRDQLLAMNFFDYTHPEDVAEDAALYARQVAGKIDRYVLRKRATKQDGTPLYLDIHSSSVKDASGFRYGVRIIQDVTLAQQMEERLRDGERKMRDLLEALPAAVYTTDEHGRITFFNRAAAELAGRTPRIGDQWCVSWRLLNPDGSALPHDQCPMAIALRENRIIRGAEAVAERPDGTRVPFVPYPTPLHDAEGKLVGAINMLLDITERKEAENRQKTLIDELNHRVKNTLATVQSLAGQTARHATSADDLYQRLEARLLALSRAHDLLTERHWENAPLGTLIEDVLLPITGEAPRRIYLQGDPVNVDTRIALNLTMVLNELMTNASKYGSLSTSSGSVCIDWARERQGLHTVLTLNWREQDGPRVTPPTRHGLGSRLMARCIERDLGGTFELAFPLGGVTCHLSVPFAGEGS